MRLSTSMGVAPITLPYLFFPGVGHLFQRDGAVQVGVWPPSRMGGSQVIGMFLRALVPSG
jgi:hypothetical protein